MQKTLFEKMKRQITTVKKIFVRKEHNFKKGRDLTDFHRWKVSTGKDDPQ
jgi:hypothetical protein